MPVYSHLLHTKRQKKVKWTTSDPYSLAVQNKHYSCTYWGSPESGYVDGTIELFGLWDFQEGICFYHKFLNCMCTVDNHFTAKKYKATLEHGLEETTWKKPFLHKFICLTAWCHTFNMRKWTNYLTFAYKLLIFGGLGMTPCVILGQFLNFSKSLVPYLQSRLILVMQDGVRLN